MVRQRDELTEAIDELAEQINWGEKILASMNEQKSAAE